MTPKELAIKTWEDVGDHRPFTELPDDYQFKLIETAKEVIAGKSGGIEGLEAFESRAKVLYADANKSVPERRVAERRVAAVAVTSERRVADRRQIAVPLPSEPVAA